MITTGLKESRLKVNEAKTELCPFYKKDTHPIEIIISNVAVKSIPHINVFGICFEFKLTWSMHIANAINKASKALYAIKLIEKYFTNFEILQLITSNFYSVLYYNSENWHLPTLKYELKQYLQKPLRFHKQTPIQWNPV